MGDISTWSPVDESNTAAPPNGWPENMQPSAVNNSARALMGAVRRWYDTVNAQLTNFLPLSGGTLTGNLVGTSIGLTGSMTSNTVSTNVYHLTGITFALRDSVNLRHDIHDFNGNVTFRMSPTNTEYFAASHVFQNKAGTGAGNLTVGYITAAGNVTLTGTAQLSVNGITNLGYANISGNVALTGAAQLNVGGNSYFNGPLTCYSTIYYGALSALSDAAVKSDVAPYTRGLDAIRQLDPVSFTYIPALRMTSNTKYGLMADDVRPVIPEMVGETDIDIDGVLQTVATTEPDHLWYVLINAVKELAARVETLEAGR